jgi:hypothetical protein
LFTAIILLEHGEELEHINIGVVSFKLISGAVEAENEGTEPVFGGDHGDGVETHE